MAFKKIENDGVWKPVTVGESVEGTYVGKDENVGGFDSTIYHLNTVNGPLSVWGSAILDQNMVYVKLNQKVKIVFTGTTPSKKGNDTKLFDVFVDDAGDVSEDIVPAQVPAPVDASEAQVPVVRPGEPVQHAPATPAVAASAVAPGIPQA